MIEAKSTVKHIYTLDDIMSERNDFYILDMFMEGKEQDNISEEESLKLAKEYIEKYNRKDRELQRIARDIRTKYYNHENFWHNET